MTDLTNFRPRMTHGALAIAAAFGCAAIAAAPVTAFADSPSPTASSSTYPAVNPTLQVSAGSVTVGGSITIAGTGYTPSETIDIDVVYGGKPQAAGTGGAGSAHPADYVVGSHTVNAVTAAYVRQAETSHLAANSAGSFTGRITLTRSGSATITATGEKSGRTSSSTVSVVAAPVVRPASSSSHHFWLHGNELLLAASVPLLALLASVVVVLRRKKVAPPKVSELSAPGDGVATA